MKTQNKNKEILFIGLAFFASYFGAGNLIFPPMLGLEAGSSWAPAIIGLVLSGIFLPLLALMIISLAGGSVDNITRRVHKHFYKILVGSIMIFANFVSVPRTAAVATEMGIQGIFPEIPYVPLVITYFFLAFLFARTRESVIDKIGKLLTPTLVIILFIIVVKGVIFPIGTTSNPVVENPFLHSFLGGYQTGDVLVSFMMAHVFIGAFTSKGFTSDKDRNNATFKACAIAFICLFIVYGGLLVIGAHSGEHFDANNIESAALLSGIVTLIGGRIGMIGFGIAVFLACFTTAVAQITSISDYFVELSKDKLNYQITAAIVAVIGTSVALMGVDKIIVFSTPLFHAMYPACLAMIILGLLRNVLPNDGSFKGSIILTLIYSLLEALLSTGLNINIINNIVTKMPLYSQGMGWIVPFLVGLILGTIIYYLTQKNKKLKV